MFPLWYLPDLHLPPLRVPQDAHRDAEVGGADPGALHTVHHHLTRQARVRKIFHQYCLKHFENISPKIFKNILLSDTLASWGKATAC